MNIFTIVIVWLVVASCAFYQHSTWEDRAREKIYQIRPSCEYDPKCYYHYDFVYWTKSNQQLAWEKLNENEEWYLESDYYKERYGIDE